MRSLIIGLIIFGLAACKNAVRDSMDFHPNQNDSTDLMVHVGEDDLIINKAISDARSTYSTFLDTFRTGCDNCYRFSVKIRLTAFDGSGAVEHVWLDSLYEKEGRLYGYLASVPEQVTGANLGDRMAVNKDILSDWMYIRNDTLIGGYTIKVFYDRMSAEEKKNLEMNFGATIR